MTRYFPFLLLIICAGLVFSAGCISNDADTFSVGLVVDERSADDPFNSQAVNAFAQLRDEGYLTYIENTDSEDEVVSAFASLAEKNPDLIAGIGYTVEQAFFDAAKENPELRFLSIDMDYEDLPENVANVKFRGEEHSFLAGYLAGMMTKTHCVGVITGMNIESTRHFVYGYKAGVEYAAGERGEDITVLLDDAGSFYDPEKGRLLALAQYGNGADIVFNVAGNTGLGVIEAANETDMYVIGIDADQNYLAPDNVLASATKSIGQTLGLVIRGYADGTDISGQVMTLGLKEGCLALEGFGDSVPSDLRSKITLIENRIISREIVPPVSADEFSVWSP